MVADDLGGGDGVAGRARGPLGISGGAGNEAPGGGGTMFILQK